MFLFLFVKLSIITIGESNEPAKLNTNEQAKELSADDLFSVNTTLGTIVGKTVIFEGILVDTFLGIPFAQPPTGVNRFKKPIDIKPWSDTLYALNQPPACPQLVLPWSELMKTSGNESEDCLYLNIHVPRMNISENIHNGNISNMNVSRNEKLSVIVFIHGGGYIHGSIGQKNWYQHDPTPLAATKNVVIVAVAYRIGLLGFLSSKGIDTKDNEEAPGNAGLHDQVMAIKWVKEHIASFGGDPNEITLMGESVGATAIGFHLLSPLSRNLFKRAILQSGSPLSFGMSMGFNNAPITMEMAAHELNCSYIPRGGDRYAKFNKDTYECLRNASVEEILEVHKKISSTGKSTGFHPIMDDDFFIDHPYDSMRMNKYGNQKELLIGTNTNEGAVFLTSVLTEFFPLRNPLAENLTLDNLKECFMKKIPEKSIQKMRPMIDSMFRFIFDNVANDDRKMIAEKFDYFMGDNTFLCPNIALIDSYTQEEETTEEENDEEEKEKEVNKKEGRKIYNYEFRKKPSQAKLMPWSMGAAHTQEMHFTFGRPLLFPNEYTNEEIQLSRNVMADWASFAKYGKPMEERKWKPCTSDERYTLVYDAPKSYLKKGFKENRCEQYFDSTYQNSITNYGYFT